MGTSDILLGGNRSLEQASNGLASCPGASSNTPRLTSCYRNRYELRPFGPLACVCLYLLPYHRWFPCEMMSEQRVQKYYTDDMHVTSQIWVVLLIGHATRENDLNQSESPDHQYLASDSSSVWNFCRCFSDNILQQNQWWYTK